MRQDTVIVAAGAAWGYYQRHSAYVCQGGRSFRSVRWMGFYRQRRIEPLVAEILDRRDHVPFTWENQRLLIASPDANDFAIARVIELSLIEGSRNEGDRHGVFLLSRGDDSRTFDLGDPIAHRGASAWTMGQRYASLSDLARASRTDNWDELLMARRPLFSTYSQGENRVTGSMIAVFQRLDVSTLTSILAQATEDHDLELLSFVLQPASGDGTVPDAEISSGFHFLFEIKTAYGVVSEVHCVDISSIFRKPAACASS